MNYKNKLKELYNERFALGEAIGPLLKPQPKAHFGLYEYYQRDEFELWMLQQSLLSKPFDYTITVTIP